MPDNVLTFPPPGNANTPPPTVIKTLEEHQRVHVRATTERMIAMLEELNAASHRLPDYQLPVLHGQLMALGPAIAFIAATHLPPLGSGGSSEHGEGGRLA